MLFGVVFIIELFLENICFWCEIVGVMFWIIGFVVMFGVVYLL